MKNLNCGIYCIINEVNGKMYIGQSINLKERERNHFKTLKGNYHTNSHLQHAYDKYGKQSLKWKILKYCKREDLNKMEQHYMNYYNSTNRNCGYNEVLKADGSVMSEETKRKISIALIGNKNGIGHKFTPEQKEKISQGNLGKIVSLETRGKLSESHKGQTAWNKGKKMSKEAREKMSYSAKGKKLSLETRGKISKAMLGRKKSEETKQRMSNSKKKRLFNKHYPENKESVML